MKKKYINILILLTFAILFSSTTVVAQKNEKGNKITVSSVVKDEKGNPIKGATIYGNEGAVTARTDATGQFTISVPDMTDILIEADGFESAIYSSGLYKNMKEFPLKATAFMFGTKDIVDLAFKKAKKGELVNAVTVLDAQDIRKYDMTNDLASAINGLVPGMMGITNMRGIGTPLFIVDGLPRDISTINMSEIDQITILKDVNSSILYGNNSATGIIQVTTKRGEAHKKQLNVEGFYGFMKPLELPKFLGSADYATLYNEALVNDGLLPQYDALTIANYRSGNKYRYPSVDYYSSDYLKAMKPFSKVYTEVSGGNEIATYYANIGFNQIGNLINFGAGKNGRQNIINARGNVDLKINSWIKGALDAVVVFNDNKGPTSTQPTPLPNPLLTYWNYAATLKPNLFTPLIPIGMVTNQDDPLLLSRKNDIDRLYILGGSQAVPTNPIADTYSGGYLQNVQRNFSFNNRIDFDLKRITQGLAFHTNLSFDFYTRYDQSVNNTYAIYQPTWSTTVDEISSLAMFNLDTRSGTQNAANAYYERRFGFYGMLDYDRSFGDHHLSGSLIGYANRYRRFGDVQGLKNANVGLRLMYSFKNKYLVDFSSSYNESVKLPTTNRWGFSPSLGLAWVISQEDFLKSVTAINYLKLRVSAGVVNSDAGIDGFYFYDDRFSTSSSYNWYEATYSTSGMLATYGPNFNMTYEKRKDFNVGLSGLFFNSLIELDANVFTSSYYDQLVRPQSQYPSFYLTFIPYQNYETNYYKGAELGLSLHKSIGDFSFVAGINGLYANSEVKKMDEIWANQFTYRTGRPVDALFGLVSDGFFADANDIATHEKQSFGPVKPGDIKYVDQDGNHIIDANDEVQIGRYMAPYSYGLNLRLSYKGFTLYAVGTGRQGADAYKNGAYFWVQGTNKYSEIALDRWTPTTASTATYPRLSSQTNSNDFRNTDFWLYRDNYFSLDKVQLTYDMPEAVARKIMMKNLSIYVQGGRLATISKYKEIRNLSVGSEPFYKQFLLGIRTMF